MSAPFKWPSVVFSFNITVHTKHAHRCFYPSFNSFTHKLYNLKQNMLRSREFSFTGNVTIHLIIYTGSLNNIPTVSMFKEDIVFQMMPVLSLPAVGIDFLLSMPHICLL